MKKIILICLLLAGTVSFGQNSIPEKDSLKFIQLTGIVITDSLYRIPFTTVGDLNTRRGTIADYYGYFALVVHPGDTVVFSCLGYDKKKFVVPDTVTTSTISLVQVLQANDIALDPVDVYPWPSREEFAEAFVNMDLADDDTRRAQQRLSPQEMAFVGALMSADAGEAYSSYRAQQARELYTRGQGPQNNLLNPAAWAEFLKGFGTGRYQISQ